MVKAIMGTFAGAALLLASTASAAGRHGHDDGYWDFRFGLGAEPRVKKGEYDFDNTFPDGDMDWDGDAAGSLEFNVAHRFPVGGPSSGFVGFGAFLRGFDGKSAADDELNIGAFGLQAGGGYSFRPNEVYTLEIGPQLGLGFAGATEKIQAFDNQELESDSGAYSRIALAVSNLFTFSRFQMSVTLGAASWAAVVNYEQQTFDTTSGTVTVPDLEVTYKGSGGFLLLAMGFR